MPALVGSCCSYFKLILGRCEVRVSTLSGALGLEGGVGVLCVERWALSCIFAWNVKMTFLRRGLAKIVVAIRSLCALLFLPTEFFLEYFYLVPLPIEWGLILRSLFHFNDLPLLSRPLYLLRFQWWCIRLRLLILIILPNDPASPPEISLVPLQEYLKLEVPQLCVFLRPLGHVHTHSAHRLNGVYRYDC